VDNYIILTPNICDSINTEVFVKISSSVLQAYLKMWFQLNRELLLIHKQFKESFNTINNTSITVQLHAISLN